MQAQGTVNNRNALLLMTGQAISRAGDQLTNVAFIWLVSTLTGSAAALGSIMTALIVPNILFRLIGGVFIDRVNRKSVMISADILRGGLVFALALLALNESLSMTYFIAIAIGLGMGTALFEPSLNSVIPAIVAKDQLLRFNSTLQTVNRSVGILVPAMAGLIIAALGIPFVLGLDGVSFLLSAVCVGLMIVPRLSEPMKKTTHSTQKEWIEGLKVVFANRYIGLLFIAIGLVNFADALVFVYPIHIDKVLGLNVSWYGFFNSAVMVGLFSTNLFYIWMGKHIQTQKAVLFGTVAQGLGVLTVGVSRNPFLGLVGFCFFGAGMASFGTATVSIIQEKIDEAFLGRVFSLYGIFGLSLMPLGYAVAGATADSLGTRVVISAAGLLILATSILLVGGHALVSRTNHLA